MAARDYYLALCAEAMALGAWWNANRIASRVWELDARLRGVAS